MENQYKFYGTEITCIDALEEIKYSIAKNGLVFLADIKALFSKPINSVDDYKTVWTSADNITLEPDPVDYGFILSLPEPKILEEKTINVEPKEDLVNHPSHYQAETGLEVYDVIEAFTFDLKGIEAYNTGNILKYMCRWKKKNKLQDLEKAEWYLKELIKHVKLLEEENK